MAAYGFLLMLMVANSWALWNPYSGARNRFPRQSLGTIECTEPAAFCSSCTQSIFCADAGFDPIVTNCTSSTVCNEEGPLLAACTSYAGTTSNDAIECDCDTIGNSGFLIDPFDSSKYMLCVPPDSQYFLSCGDGEVFSTTDNACIVAPTTTPATTTPPTTATTTPDPDSPGGIDQKDTSTDVEFCAAQGIGLHTDDPTCQTYAACYSETLPGLLLNCNAGEVFDSSALKCVPECDLTPAAFSCPSGAAGALPDTVDCSIFHVCSNGLLVTPAAGIPCQDGQVFEPTSMTCVADSPDAVCPEVDSCWAAYCESCGETCPESRSFTTTPEPTTPTTAPFTTTTTIPTPDFSPRITSTTTVPTTTTTTPKITTTTTVPTTTPATTTPGTTTPPTTTPPTTTPPTTTPETTTPPTTTPPTTTPETTTITTPSPPDCGNSAGVYEDTSDCSQFYSCNLSDDGVTYEAVLFSCPTPLVFVPSFGYCFLQSALPTAPGCIAS